MNQHFIQKSWLKQFKSSDGKVEVVVTASMESLQRKPKEIAAEQNFQDVDQENEDKQVESKAISVLHNLKKGLTQVPNDSRGILEEWVALHLARSLRSRESILNLSVSYSKARSSFVSADLADVKTFDEVWVYRSKKNDEPLILSDNPIVFLQDISLIFPFSPYVFVMFTKQDPRLAVIEERTWPQLINEMSFANATTEVYGNPDTRPPWNIIRERACKNVLIEIREKQVRVRQK
ncbi:MAG: DUF4238 domain-containing protein [Thermosynechococcaceae cyanobacterium]